jgi:2-oxo-3-hexenedioate decarboxylase
MRAARGESPVGRKIGFTNRSTWTEFSPMWGFVFDRTMHDLSDIGETFSLAGLSEPRIEPEVVFRLAEAPAPGMDEPALLACIDRIAHGFEIVQSIFPGWAFSMPDSVAANGLHGVLLIGPWHDATSSSEEWQRTLTSFEIELARDGTVVARGQGSDVLDGPLTALRHLVDLLARDPSNPPLAAGEIVTTGTLTRACPVAPGQTWETEPTGLALDGITVRFT